jgi:hypothetical protein
MDNTNDEKEAELFQDALEDYIGNLKDIDPEITKIVDDNFWDLL